MGQVNAPYTYVHSKFERKKYKQVRLTLPKSLKILYQAGPAY